MKLQNKLLFILPFLSVVITSCSDTASEIPEVLPPESPAVFWEQSYLSMLGWKGCVKEVKETSFQKLEDIENEEEFSSVRWKFDDRGHLTYYNPTGVESETFSRNVWQTFASYSYEYDESGKLIKAIVDDFSGTLTTYVLKYGEHTRYVPLVFPFGAFDFFIIKGLESITCTTDDENETIACQYDGNIVSCTTESWSGLITTVYDYVESENYPVKRTTTVTRDGVIEHQETTAYVYNTDGSLSLVDTSVQEENIEIERTKIRYLEGTLNITTQKTDAGGQTFDWTYSYDKAGKWIAASYLQDKDSEDEMTANESCVYSRQDSNGNWIETIQQQSSLVNPLHADGTVKVYRTITYY